jgi:pyruvate/2-oxoglutarate dehydrogenase complex dihydrolipoamide acyltransferase (E2) component
MMIAADEERAKLDAALDAALDALDDSEDEEEVGNQHPSDDDGGTSQTDTLPVRQSLARSNEANNTPGSNVAASPSVAPSNPVAMGPPRPPDSWSPEKLFEEMMHQMIEGGGNHADNDNGSSNAMMEDFGKLLEEMQRFEVQEGSSNHSKGKDIPKSNGKAAKTGRTAPPKSAQTKPKSAATASPQRKTDSAAPCNSTLPSALPDAAAAAAAVDQQAEELQAALATMMQGLEQAQQRMADSDQGGHNNDDHAAASDDEEFVMMQNLLESLASAAGIVDSGSVKDGGNNEDNDASAFNADAVVNGMMEQLLSKDLMYDPMKQVATRFPDWLREHHGRLSATELAEYVFKV